MLSTPDMQYEPNWANSIDSSLADIDFGHKKSSGEIKSQD